MESKKTKDINLNIFGKSFHIKSDEDEEYSKKIASFLSNEMKEISKHIGAEKFDKIAIIAALNITDKFFKEREKYCIIDDKLSNLIDKTKKK